MSWDLVAYFVATGFFNVLAVYGLLTKRWRPWAVFGAVLAVVLNARFFFPGLSYGFGQTTAVTDVTLDLVHGDVAGLDNVATCPANECTTDADGETLHTSWSVVFFDRFVNGSASQKAMLYAHIIGNTVALVLVTLQLLRRPSPAHATKAQMARHRQLGKASFAAMAVGVLFGAVLASQHTTIPEYGGTWSMLGLWEMSACVAVTGVLGVRHARAKDLELHRIWMWRHAGSLWGSYFGFRTIMFVSDPIFINLEGVAWNLSAWGGAPLGIAIAEIARRRLDPARTTPPDRSLAATL